MKENKPILFINSASTNNFYQQNQYEYDSRKKNQNNIVKKNNPKNNELINEREVEQPKIEEVNTNVIIEDPITDISNVIEEETSQQAETEAVIIENPIPQETKIEKPFSNKIRLLNKRALLNRYVLVGIVLADGEIEGLFKGTTDQNVVLESNGEDLNISIDEIVDIRIIRV